MTTSTEATSDGRAVSANDPGSANLTVNVIGYLDDALGVAEAARLYVETLRAAGVPVTTTAVSPDPDHTGRDVLTRDGRRAYPHIEAAGQPRFNLLCLQGEPLETFARSRGREVLGDRP